MSGRAQREAWDEYSASRACYIAQWKIGVITHLAAHKTASRAPMDNEFDFPAFLDSLNGLSYREMKDKVIAKHQMMLRLSNNRSRKKLGGVEIRNLAARMQGQMSGILYFFEHFQKPGGMSDQDFLRLKPLCRALVEKGPFPPSALDAFKRPRE